MKRKQLLLIRQMISILLGLALMFAAIKFVKSTFADKNEKQLPKRPYAVRKVLVRNIENKNVDYDISIQGRTAAFNKMEIFSEVTGVFKGSTRPLKPGTTFYKGDILMRVENNVQSNAIKSQRSNLINQITRMMPDLKIDYPQSFAKWDAYLKKIDVSQSFPPLPEAINEREKSYVTGNGIYQAYYDIQTNELQLGKYIVKAPFTGKIVSGNVQKGTLIRQGQKVGELLDLNKFELAVPLTLAELQTVKKGNKVALKSNETEAIYTGVVTRFSDQVDPTTQSVTAYLSIRGKDIKENMYLEGKISVAPIQNGVALDQNTIIDDKYIFLVSEGKLKKIVVEIVGKDQETLIVKGVPEGAKVLEEVFTGATEGMKVEIVNPTK